jgi:hypothetical protein
MKKYLSSLTLALGIFLFSIGTAQAIKLVEVQTVSHGAVAPGRSNSHHFPFDYGKTPLVTVLNHTGSSTLIYTIEFVSPSLIVIRIHNIGLLTQSGTVTLGFWE